jgi:hypothetical protein
MLAPMHPLGMVFENFPAMYVCMYKKVLCKIGCHAS